MKKYFIYLIAPIVFFSCSKNLEDLTLDGSSTESIENSILAMEEHLTEEELEEFSIAILFVALDEVTAIDLLVSVVDPSELDEEARGKLDGLTYEELLEKSKQVRKRKGKIFRKKLESIME